MDWALDFAGADGKTRMRLTVACGVTDTHVPVDPPQWFSIPQKCLPMSAFVRIVSGTAALLCLLTPPLPATGQLRIDPEPVYQFGDDDLFWDDVRALDVSDSLLVVLTESDPVLHLFSLDSGTHLRSWGLKGEGPGEFASSADVAWVGSLIYALDTSERRVSIFEANGELVKTVPVSGLGLPFTNRMDHVSGDTVVFTAYEPMGGGNAVVAWTADGFVRTVVEYDDPPQVRLEAPDAPGLTLAAPFTARMRWTVVAGEVVYWSGSGEQLEATSVDGTATHTLSLPVSDRFEVTADDRESWIRTGIPTEFMGRRPFEPLRAVARETVEFPDHHALVRQLLTDDQDRIWVRRNRSGEPVWDVVERTGQMSGRVTLPRGFSLRAVIPGYVVTTLTDELGVETVRVHRLAGS